MIFKLGAVASKTQLNEFLHRNWWSEEDIYSTMIQRKNSTQGPINSNHRLPTLTSKPNSHGRSCIFWWYLLYIMNCQNSVIPLQAIRIYCNWFVWAGYSWRRRNKTVILLDDSRQFLKIVALSDYRLFRRMQHDLSLHSKKLKIGSKRE